jgi:60 kDa SS-A/Ro ribonucleoprotein
MGFTSGSSGRAYWGPRSGSLDGFIDLGISAGNTLEGAAAACRKQNFGSTDCALPMLYALKHKLDVDVFCVYTDNETWSGEIHPFQALKKYREKTGINAKLIVVGMAANPFTIADPNDVGMLDVVGFDASAPAVMANFAR